MRIAIFTHVIHIKKGSEYFGYAPYVREMQIWIRQFQNAEIIAPINNLEKEGANISYGSSITFNSIPFIRLGSVKEYFLTLIKVPLIIIKIFQAMSRADHLHIRCPGNIGLLACLVQIFFPKKRKTVKFAGNWDPKSHQPWSYRLQKWILNNTLLTHNIIVLVYGDWPGSSENIKPFFTASFSEKVKEIVKPKYFELPYIFLFVGNLVPGKRPLHVIQLIDQLRQMKIDCFLKIFGDGPEREVMEKYCKLRGLEDVVKFMGNQPLEKVKEALNNADFLALPSKSEGWPKAVAEAMFFGCIPIATPISCIPWMLGNGKRGIIFESETTIVSDKIVALFKNKGALLTMSTSAKKWSQEFTLEKFESEIKFLLKNQLRQGGNEK